MATDFLERTLEDIIYNTSKGDLVMRGLFIEGKRFRQVRLGNYGIADMITVKSSRDYPWDDHYLSITVYELKKDEININTLLQASRYIKGIERYFKKTGRFEKFDIRYSIELIGNKVEDNSDFVFLIDFIDNFKCYTYSYDFDGISFKSKYGYSKISEGF